MRGFLDNLALLQSINRAAAGALSDRIEMQPRTAKA